MEICGQSFNVTVQRKIERATFKLCESVRAVRHDIEANTWRSMSHFRSERTDHRHGAVVSGGNAEGAPGSSWFEIHAVGHSPESSQYFTDERS